MFAIMFRRTIVSEDVVQGIIIGGVLAFITAQIIMNAYVTTVNGWTTIFGCGELGNGILFKAACANKLPAVNVSRPRTSSYSGCACMCPEQPCSTASTRFRRWSK
jgi:hypothetical protein